MYSDDDNQMACGACPSGKYSAVNSPTRILCQQCDPGRFGNSNSSTVCSDCPAGKYSDESGLSGCKPCASGKFQTEDGKKFCDDIKEGKFTAIGGSAGVPQECPKPTTDGRVGADCEGGILKERAEFWRDPAMGPVVANTTYYRCPNPQACPGGASCAGGHRGPLCAVCEPKFTMTLGVCNECPSQEEANKLVWTAVGPLVGGLMCIALLAKQRHKLKKALVSQRVKSLLKISVGFCKLLHRPPLLP
jgi:hypothetical protein